MVLSIQETLHEVIGSDYPSEYGPVVRDAIRRLEEREQQIIRSLFDSASDANLDMEHVRDAFNKAGLVPPTPTAVSPWLDAEAKIDALKAEMDSIIARLRDLR
jgi:hypothetical protein